MGDQVIQLKVSPSLQYQNLSFGEGKFVYIHKSEVHILNTSNKETSSLQVKEKVYQAKVCEVNGQNFIVVAVQGGVQFWDLGKEKCLFTVPYQEEGSFLSRGIAAIGSSVFTGTSTGAIAVIDVKSEGASVAQIFREHKDFISDISAGTLAGLPVVASADLAGEVLLWDQTGSILARMDKSPGDTVSCVAVTPLNVVCGYGSGKIRLFNGAGKKTVEIAAHCRWINALDYCETRNWLASVSEDMVAQVWQLSSETDPKVSLRSSKLLKDCLLSRPQLPGQICIHFCGDESRKAPRMI
eukprot:GGOE01055122.1.p1 GENE.GGOE01055122.1~~GGOE01055122.1.p1  ORF type:complete len:313 (+),score=11.71 GGOE01055122.1:49-939(+)